MPNPAELASATAPDAGTRSDCPRSVEIAYESVFSSLTLLYRAHAKVIESLIGLRVRGGRAFETDVEFVKVPDRVPVLIERLRRRCGIVAHVHVARKPAGNVPGRAHPERRAHIVIDIYDERNAYTARCRVNRANRQIQFSPLTNGREN